MGSGSRTRPEAPGKRAASALSTAVGQILGVSAPGVDALLLQRLDEGHDAVVGGEDHQDASLARAALRLLQETAERAVQPEEVVHLLLAVGAEGVADDVAGREAHGQDVGGLVRAQVVGLHRGRGQVEEHLVGEGRAAQVVVEIEGRRGAGETVREHRVLAIPLALHVVLAGVADVGRRVREQPLPDAARVGVRQAPRVPAHEPARRLGHVPAAGDEAAAGRLVPVRRVGAPAGHQDRRAVLEGHAHDLRAPASAP